MNTGLVIGKHIAIHHNNFTPNEKQFELLGLPLLSGTHQRICTNSGYVPVRTLALPALSGKFVLKKMKRTTVIYSTLCVRHYLKRGLHRRESSQIFTIKTSHSQQTEKKIRC